MSIAGVEKIPLADGSMIFAKRSRAEFARQLVEQMGVSASKFSHQGLGIAVGGDGTLHALLPWALANRVPVLALPFGTANDFCRMTGMSGLNHAEALPTAWLDSLQSQPWTVGELNGRPWITISGLGVGHRVCHFYNSFRERFIWARLAATLLGRTCYEILSLLLVLFAPGPRMDLMIKTDKGKKRIQSHVLFVCNQGVLCGKLKISPMSDPNDEFLELVYLPAPTGFWASRYALLRALLGFRFNQPHPELKTIRSRRMVITPLGAASLPVFADGEAWRQEGSLTWSIHPRGLEVLCSESNPRRISRSPTTPAMSPPAKSIPNP